jgi:hypothetical protein
MSIHLSDTVSAYANIVPEINFEYSTFTKDLAATPNTLKGKGQEKPFYPEGFFRIREMISFMVIRFIYL